ncbi:hypothetical protein ACI782_07995 [Geodermatophilus sp. SYSU D00703]
MTAPTRAADDVSAARVFARACAAEWTRLWTVQASWWYLAVAAVAVVGIGVIGGLDATGDGGPAPGTPAWVVAAVAAVPAQFALLALTVSAVTADYATGGIVPTLQWTPRRGVLYLARGSVVVGTATGVGVLLAAACAAAAALVARPTLTLLVGEGLDVLGTVALVVAAGTALAVGLGFLLRHTAGGLVAVFLLMLVLPLFLPQFGYAWTSALAEVLPGSGAAFLLLDEVPGMTAASSVTALVAWAGGALLLGWLRLARDDANR